MSQSLFGGLGKDIQILDALQRKKDETRVPAVLGDSRQDHLTRLSLTDRYYSTMLRITILDLEYALPENESSTYSKDLRYLSIVTNTWASLAQHFKTAW